MVRSRQVKGAGSAPTEGARRATGVGADAAAMGSGALVPGQRWSASRKRDVVLRLLRGEPLDAVSREVGVEVYVQSYLERLPGLLAAVSSVGVGCPDRTVSGQPPGERPTITSPAVRPCSPLQLQA